jgi:Putative DNA-binding domain
MTPHLATLTLRAFQDEFAQALLAADSAAIPATDLAALIAEPGFAVYRNTVMKGCVDALQANYPAVERLVGEEWLRAAAAVYARAELPSHPTLLDYGAGFAGFLQTFSPAAALPYLADVARLDRFWSEAHTARDEEPLEPAVIRQRSLDEFARVVLRPHAASRWAWFDALPIFTIWQRNRDAAFDHEAAPQIAWTGEGALITRPHGAVQSTMLNAGGCALLDACVAGRPLPEAAEAALAADGNTNLTQLMSTLLKAGAFADAVDEREGAADG